MRRFLLASLLATAAPLAAQQVADTAFAPPVPRPAYKEGAGPLILLDEAHHNFHTVDGRYMAFAKLARRDGYRVYGSGGYFSRGALFGSGALEVPLHERFIATGVLVYTRALNNDLNADMLGLSKIRMDLSGAAAYVLTPSFVVFGSLGRTISSNDVNASSLMVSGGISISFVGRSSVRGRTH